MINILNFKERNKLIKFGFVGALGTIPNLAIFFVFVDIIGVNANLIVNVAFLFAVTQNYILNHLWTFKEQTKNYKISFSGWAKFVLTSLLGLLVNIIMLNIILYFFDPEIKVIAQIFGILSGMIFNYTGSKLFVF